MKHFFLNFSNKENNILTPEEVSKLEKILFIKSYKTKITIYNNFNNMMKDLNIQQIRKYY